MKLLIDRLRREERGSWAIEFIGGFVIITLAVAFVAAVGTLSYTNSLVHSAAANAARAATLSTSIETAQSSAIDAANLNLEISGVNCATVAVDVDTSHMIQPLGVAGYVTVDVSCTLDLGWATAVGFAPSITMNATATSPTDPFSES